MAGQNVSIALPPPPPDRTRAARIYLIVLAAISVGAAAVAGEPAFALLAVLCVALLFIVVRGRNQEVGAALAMAALDRAARGRTDEARALLDAISPNVLTSYIGQMVDSQRAALALYEGDLEAAVALATKGAREGKRLGTTDQLHQGSALSIRAVALAGLGRKAESLSDVAVLRMAEYRQGVFVARACLAEAILFAREKDLEGLAKVLRDERALLFGATGPRDRMIVRALARMVAAKKVSVYREAAKREAEELDENASWVARLAPEAASYARAPKLGMPLDAPEAVDPKAVLEAQKAAPKPASKWKRVAALWSVLVVMFLGVWHFVSPAAAPTPTFHEPTPNGNTSATAITIFMGTAWALLAAGILVFLRARAKKLTVELSRAVELRLRGRHDEAKAAFVKLAREKTLLVAPQAERELATIALLAGDAKGAETHAEAGIRAAHVSAVSVALSRQVLLPQLHGELAVAFATEGRLARAEEEIAKLHTLFPTYPYLARDTFRARLVGLTATSRLDEAAEMARTRPADLPINQEEELVCDMLRVHAGDSLPEGERERVELELRDQPEGAFVDRVAKALRHELQLRHGMVGPRARVAQGTESDDAPYSELPTSEEAVSEEPADRTEHV
jgi:hypothetical protein